MKTILLIASAWLLFAAAALAQMQPPGPGPELKKIDYFAGSWTLTGDMKASAMGPAGTMTEKETCKWMDGNFYLVCQSDYSSSMGNGTGLSILGYSSDDRKYTYREFNSWGEFDDSRGTVDGDTWTWTSDEKMAGKSMQGRFTMKIVSPTSYNFTFEMSPDGSAWTNIMDGKATKN